MEELRHISSYHYYRKQHWKSYMGTWSSIYGIQELVVLVVKYMWYKGFWWVQVTYLHTDHIIKQTHVLLLCVIYVMRRYHGKPDTESYHNAVKLTWYQCQQCATILQYVKAYNGMDSMFNFMINLMFCMKWIQVLLFRYQLPLLNNGP